jgi:hypothetical protein
MKQPVRIFQCPCEGKKFKLAGEPNDNPTLKEKGNMVNTLRLDVA